jgi:hypothetical protein
VKRSGLTLLELLPAIFVFAAIMLAWVIFSPAYDRLWGVLAAEFLAALLCIIAVVLFYRWLWRLDERGLRNVRERYRHIYRVIAMPTDPTVIVIAEGAEIRVGDFGWEAGPPRDDGLIYLQGLTQDWTVVWHVGLRSSEVEEVGTKPYSQYDAWHPYWAGPPPLPPCPFPVIERDTMTMGRPHYREDYCVAPALYRARQVGERINVRGVAWNYKLGAFLAGPNLWVDVPSASWPSDVASNRVEVTGTVAERYDLPVFINDPCKPPGPGVPVFFGTDLHEASRRLILEDATWKIVSRRDRQKW